MNKNYFLCINFLFVSCLLFSCSNSLSIKRPADSNTQSQDSDSNLTDKDDNYYLKSIDYSCGFLSPDFDKNTHDYILFVP